MNWRITSYCIVLLFLFQLTAFASSVRMLYLASSARLMKEPAAVKCRLVKRKRFVAVIDITGENRYSGYYVVFGNWIHGEKNKLKNKPANCLTDGKYIVLLKAQR